MPLEHVQISDDIISFCQKYIEVKTESEYLVTLTDHINFAIDRYKKGINLENALLWEIKRFYPQEYELGEYSIRLIRDRLHVDLPEDEAGFIALSLCKCRVWHRYPRRASFSESDEGYLAIVTEELGIELDEGIPSIMSGLSLM